MLRCQTSRCAACHWHKCQALHQQLVWGTQHYAELLCNNLYLDFLCDATPQAMLQGTFWHGCQVSFLGLPGMSDILFSNACPFLVCKTLLHLTKTALARSIASNDRCRDPCSPQAAGDELLHNVGCHDLGNIKAQIANAFQDAGALRHLVRWH